MQRMIEAVMRRSILVVIAVLLILGWGAVSAYQMERDYLPPINNTTLMISVRADNYQADQVKESIAGIIDQAIKNVNGLQSVETNSFNGGMLCSLSFPYQFDMEKAEGEVSQVLAGLNFPSGVQKPLVTRVSTSSFPIMQLSIVGQSPQVDENSLRTSLQNLAASQLKTVPGVAAIRITGGGQKGYAVTIRTKDLAKHGLTLDDVKQSLMSMNTDWPQGKMVSNQIMVPVRVSGWAPTLGDLKEIGIHGKDGSITPLAAVADVCPSLIDEQTVSRTDGKPSVVLDVLKQPSANITEVARQVHQRMQELRGELPNGVQLSVQFDQAADVQSSLRGLIREGLWGCLFSMLSVLLFLRNVRSTVLIALSLPICLLAAAAVLKEMGISLNILTVSGLVVAMGRVVDDSIVIIDNIHRKIEASDVGEARFYRLGAAVEEMMPAIISSTATTICVFLPITLVGGLVQASFSVFAWAVVIALIVSLLVSLFVVPVFAQLWWGQKLQGSSKMVLEPYVRRVLHWAIFQRKWVVGLSIVIFAGTLVLAAFLPVNVLPASGPRTISIQVSLPEGSSPAAVNSEVKRVENLLKKEPQIETFSSSYGSSLIPHFDDVFDDGGGWIQSAMEANLSVKVKQNVDLNAYTAQLQNELRSFPSDAIFTVSNQNISGDDSQLKVVLSGADAQTLDHAARIIRSKLQLVPSLSAEGAENERAENSSYHLVLNRNKIKETGVKTEDILNRIQPYMSQGLRLDIAAGDHQDPIVLNTDLSAASRPGKDIFTLFGNETFQTKDGKTVKLQQLLSPAPGSTLPVYRERDGKPISVVTANITTPDVERVTKQAERVLTGVSLPKGVSYTIGGISQQEEQMIVDIAIALSISTLLVLFIVSTVFRGWKALVSVLVCIPLLLIGSVWGMVLFGKEWNLAAFIGLLMLVGIVVTNGIVLVDKIERNIKSGMLPKEAIMQGTLSRVRPVLMTAFTTILTLLPLASSNRADSVISQTLGIVVVGGMLSSTLISLVFIPILYDWMYKSPLAQPEKGVPVFERNRDIQTMP
jgi:hydrophobic/amphiphilic exporter-1 (mainly G- bacteria), HAE1 family